MLGELWFGKQINPMLRENEAHPGLSAGELHAGNHLKVLSRG